MELKNVVYNLFATRKFRSPGLETSLYKRKVLGNRMPVPFVLCVFGEG